MDSEIRDRGNDALRKLILNTRAGIKTQVTDLNLIRQCKEARFVPLANFGNIRASGQFIVPSGTGYTTSLCAHTHKKKRQAKMCLRRAVHRKWVFYLASQ